MPKIPFTQAGMLLKLQDLYAMSDIQLAGVGKLIVTDFGKWIDDNFDLSAQQRAYLMDTPALIRDHWGYSVGAAVVCRGDIELPKPKNYGPPQRPKQVKVRYQGGSLYKPNPTGGYDFTHDLKVVFEFIYP